MKQLMGRKRTYAAAAVMRSKPLLIIVLLAVVAGLSACGRKETQKSLARRFSEADRAIVTYDMGGGLKASMTLTTEETKKLIGAVANGERTYSSVDATVDIPIEFYNGTNSLGKLRSAGSGQVFWTAHAVYREATGTLESFFRRARTLAASATPQPAP